MTIEVEIAGTGQIVEFPDGTTNEVITQALSQFSTRQQAPPTPFQEKPIPERLQSIAGGVANLATGALGTAGGGLMGLATVGIQGASNILTGESEVDPFAAGAGVAKGVQESLTTEFQGGQELTQEVLEGVINIAKEKAGPDFVEVAGAGVDAVKAADQEILERFGPAVATLVRTAVVGAPEIFAGRGLLSAAPKQSLKTPFTKTTETKQAVIDLIESGSTDVDTALFKVVDGDLKKNPLATAAVKQGIDEGVIPLITQGTPATRGKFREMVDIMEKGIKNERFKLQNRPSKVAGDSLMQRVIVLKKANKKAGKKLGAIAKGLRNEKVDASVPYDQFLGTLGDMGVRFSKKGKPNYDDSAIADLPAIQAPISRAVRRVMRKKDPTALELHELKQFLSEGLFSAKQAEGLTARTQGVLEKLRSGVDRVLDRNFPEYDAVNVDFSDTVSALKTLESVSGKKLINPEPGEALGTLMRRLMSNADTRVPLMASIKQIDETAARHGGNFNDNLFDQAIFVDELDRVFKTAPRTSFQGQISQALDEPIPLTPGQVGVQLATKGLKKFRDINREAGIKALKELIGDR